MVVDHRQSANEYAEGSFARRVGVKSTWLCARGFFLSLRQMRDCSFIVAFVESHSSRFNGC